MNISSELSYTSLLEPCYLSVFFPKIYKAYGLYENDFRTFFMPRRKFCCSLQEIVFLVDILEEDRGFMYKFCTEEGDSLFAKKSRGLYSKLPYCFTQAVLIWDVHWTFDKLVKCIGTGVIRIKQPTESSEAQYQSVSSYYFHLGIFRQ